METFSLTVGNAWTSLAVLLQAEPDFKNQYMAQDFFVRCTHATQTMIVKTGVTQQPTLNKGVNLTAGTGAFNNTTFWGRINLAQVWVFGSGAGTTFDIAFARDSGVGR